MGAKTGILVHADGDVAEVLRRAPPLDRDACRLLVSRLYAGERVEEIGDGCLGESAYPPEGVVYVGCFPGVEIVTDLALMVDRPSELFPRHVARGGRRTYLHAMHSVVDWLAFGVWHDGVQIRSLSMSPDDGIMESVGDPLPFELPYWAGEHPADPHHDSDYPFPFHPLDLGEAALEFFFGFRMEGHPTGIAPCDIPLMGFRVDGHV
ncbi:DUF6928 family protein [Streptosporangium fragile]